MPEFGTPQPIAITVDVLLGEVKILASDRTDTVVEVRPSDAAKKDDVHAAQETEVDFAAGQLTVKAPRGGRCTPLRHPHTAAPQLAARSALSRHVPEQPADAADIPAAVQVRVRQHARCWYRRKLHQLPDPGRAAP